MARKKNYKVYQHFFAYQTPYLSLIMTFTGACALFLALVTFSQWDPSSFYHSTEYEKIHNWYGALGALVSSWLFYYIGYSAFIIPAFLLFSFYVTMYQESFRKRIDQLLGWVGLFATSMPLFYYLNISPAFYLLPGGVIGKTLYHSAAYYCGAFTTVSGLCIVSAASAILITRLSCAHLVLAIFYLRKIFLYTLRYAIRPLSSGTLSTITFVSRYIRRGITFLYAAMWSEKSIASSEHVQEAQQENNRVDNLQEPVVHDDSSHNAVAGSNEKSETNVTASSVQTHGTHTIKDKLTSLFKLPTDALLHPLTSTSSLQSTTTTNYLSDILEQKLARFGIQGKVVGVKQGPVVTLFEYQPDPDAKVSRILALEDDLAMALEALSVRIIAPIPGTSRVGIEVANKERQAVYMNEIIRSAAFKKSSAALPFVLGKDTVGNNIVADLTQMPHLLVAGSTGSGKSVCLNTLLISLLCKLSPDELKLVIIDPKRLEFTSYHDIPHLLFPVITHPSKAAPVLNWLTKVMEERYEKMAQNNVRNIGEYKKMCKSQVKEDDLPYIVVIIDELADLMIIARKEIEDSIARLAQMARAAGIHLILATQRPSVDVLTGVIKVNFPSRIAFRVSSKIDSRTIIDTVGAEKLLGKGDMLFMDAHSAGMRRVHGAYITDTEINNIVDFIKKQRAPEYIDLQTIIAQHSTAVKQDNEDPLLPEIIQSLQFIDELSISSLQRKYSIGYNRSARLVEHLEAMGYLMPADGGKMRKVIK